MFNIWPIQMLFIIAFATEESRLEEENLQKKMLIVNGDDSKEKRR